MASINTTVHTLTTNLTGIRFDSNGDVHIDFQMIDAGAVTQSRSLICKADGTGVYDQRDGSQVAAVTPAALLTGSTNVQAAVNAALSAAATAGKLVA